LERKSNILLTQNSFDKFAGSEMVTLELYDYFKSRDYNVTIFTNYVSDKMKTYFKLKEINFKDSLNFESEQSYEIIWIHQNVIPSVILKKINNEINVKNFIFHHMSPFEPFEQPIANQIENEIATLILANSEETKRKIIVNGLDPNKIEVFGNPGPEEFIMKAKSKAELKNLLVVTNHRCKEMWNAIERLPKEINVRHVGNSESSDIGNRRLIPEDMNWADAVISIGKTVQYSILASRPVYNYDIHGGAGWLSESDTFLKSKDLNFSGRGFELKSSDQILSEILNLFPEAHKFVFEINNEQKNAYLLSTKLENIIKNMELMEQPVTTINLRNLLLGWDLAQNLIKREHLHSRSLEVKVHNLQLKLHNVVIERDNIYSSKTWKITRPLRTLKSMIFRPKIKN
jgi:hypothetical protein